MRCAWKELLAVLPQWMRLEVDRLGKDRLQELRLRINAPPELIMSDRTAWMDRCILAEDLQFCINAASRYSPWAAESAALGYITAPGGHRIGLCGEAVIHNGTVTGMRTLRSLCIRVARDFPGIGNGLHAADSLLILGAPGWGKTTLLRDIARTIAERDTVAVVDERGELYPNGFQWGKRMDILTGCPKQQGIERVLRTMGPEWIAVDEITAAEDCNAIVRAFGCGVRLLATVHATSLQDYLSRAVYHPLVENLVFTQFLILNKRKQWRLERMSGCL